MGTNFYYYSQPTCPHCKRPHESRHIGKSSGGWCFALHVYPEEGINSLDDWINLFYKMGSHIEDEYGRIVSPKEMLDVIKKKRRSEMNYSYKTLKEFCETNKCDIGPNGLFRSNIDGFHCIGHGEGTWDYFTGEFS